MRIVVFVMGTVAVTLAGGGAAAAQSKQPDFSVLATTPGTEADHALQRDAPADVANPKRRLHLEGLGVGYNVNDRLTVKGGFRAGGLGDDSGTSGTPSGGFFLGIRRTLGRQ